ncbi:MAG TPA: ferredoxin reductase [Polyangiales bacterium]
MTTTRSALPSALAALRRPAGALLRTRLVASLTAPRGVDHYVQLLAPTWSSSQIRARIVSVDRETEDTVSLRLTPNDNWLGFQAGQHLHLSVTIDGVRHTRTFSISSAPCEGSPLRLTIRAFPGGRVSNWALRDARVGDVVELSAAQGQFVWRGPASTDLLFVSGGSGLTPIRSLVQQLLHDGHAGQLTCLHYARGEVLFHSELDALGRAFRNFRFVPRLRAGLTAPAAAAARFSLDELSAVHPAWQQSEVFVCGPSSLEHSVRDAWATAAPATQLHSEHFRQVASGLAASGADAAARYQLVFEKSRAAISGHGAASLLEQAEAAGLRPAYGCRMGICHTCKCRKRSGVVRNLITGQVSDAAEGSIQLCVNAPLSDLTLDA